MKIFISSALVILFWGSCEGAEAKARQKRVLYGSPVTVYNAYQSPGYFVRIDEASTWSWLLSLIGIKPTTGDQLCGGAALTSYVVQTACHCLVVTWSITIYPYRYPIVQNGWENMLLLHHMHLVESTMKDGVWSRKFFVHQNCKQVNASQALSHDFGWIITKKPLPGTHGDKVPEGAAFAPVMTEGELAIQYYRNMKSEAICLIIGFGAYDWVKKRGNVIYGESSPVLQHGWRNLRDYWKCYRYHDRDNEVGYGRRIDQEKDKLQAYLTHNYTEDATWVCTTTFGKQRAYQAKGDSGGPVTCDGGLYFSIVSTGSYDIDKPTHKSWQRSSALVFSPFENAAEYREDMIRRIVEYAGNGDEKPPDVQKLFTIDPFHPDGYYHLKEPGSRSLHPQGKRNFDESFDRSHCKSSHGTSSLTFKVLLPIFILNTISSSS